MKTYIKTVMILCITGLAIAGCKKEGCTDPTAINYDDKAKKDDASCEYPADSEADITLHHPMAGGTYGLNDTVFIHGSISHSTGMHGYEIYLKNTSTSDTVFHYHAHTHASNYPLDTFWINNVSVHSDMQLEVRALLDHSATTATVETVNFHCHPM